MQLNDASFSQLSVIAFFYCGADSVSVNCQLIIQVVVLLDGYLTFPKCFFISGAKRKSL